MKKLKIRDLKVDFPLATLTIDQMADDFDILTEIYNVDPEAVFRLTFVERNFLLQKYREVTGGKLEKGDLEGDFTE